jgi:hypothetical protein
VCLFFVVVLPACNYYSSKYSVLDIYKSKTVIVDRNPLSVSCTERNLAIHKGIYPQSQDPKCEGRLMERAKKGGKYQNPACQHKLLPYYSPQNESLALHAVYKVSVNTPLNIFFILGEDCKISGLFIQFSLSLLLGKSLMVEPSSSQAGSIYFSRSSVNDSSLKNYLYVRANLDCTTFNFR